jgi:hypothetical protein
MPEPDPVGTLIDRIVAEAQIARRADREDLRRELSTHFEDAAAGSSVQSAVQRFGDEAAVTACLRRVYRSDYVLLYAARLAASLAVCVAAALMIQVAVNLRLEGAQAWRLTPGFPRAAAVSVVVVLGFVAAWELGRRPLGLTRAAAVCGAYAVMSVLLQWSSSPGIVGTFITSTALVGIGSLCARLPRWPLRIAIAFAAFAATLYLAHLHLAGAFGVARAALSGGVYVAVWTSTLAILARFDRKGSGVFLR